MQGYSVYQITLFHSYVSGLLSELKIYDTATHIDRNNLYQYYLIIVRCFIYKNICP